MTGVEETRNDTERIAARTEYAADAIVVLGGGINPDSSLPQVACARVDRAIELYHAGIAPRIILSEYVNKGRMSLNKYVELTSWNPAHVWQVYPQKGVIQVGSDADVCGAGAVYLCSDAAGHVHGQMLLIDGGMSATLIGPSLSPRNCSSAARSAARASTQRSK